MLIFFLIFLNCSFFSARHELEEMRQTSPAEGSEVDEEEITEVTLGSESQRSEPASSGANKLAGRSKRKKKKGTLDRKVCIVCCVCI